MTPSPASKQIAFLLRRDPAEVEKAWRKAKRFCSDAGNKGDYLRVLSVALTLLKWPEDRLKRIPSLGDEVELVPKLKGTIIRSDANAVYIEVDAAAPVLVVYPLWGFVTWS